MFAASKTAAITTAANWIEECFSVYLYTGTGATQTITNGIDLSTYGGLVWRKSRTQPSGAGYFHKLMDTARGTSSVLFSNTTDAATTAAELSSFNSNGFTMNAGSGYANQSGDTYASWTFRKQAKFFDIVTWTGDGTNPRTINHNLGSTPGCIIIKCTSAVADWPVWHRSLSTQGGFLNTIDAFSSGLQYFGSTVTSTTFSLNSANVRTNQNGATYVAYLFAHDAGGFGPAGSDNVISCGSFTTDGAGAATLTLNYEPQFIIIKNSSSAEDWVTLDNMRGWTNGSGGEAVLNPNLSSAESSGNYGNLTSTGATWANLSVSKTYIYIAIRRGPMKTPTSGTSVYEGTAYTGNATAQRQIGSTVLMDALLLSCRSANSTGWSSYAHYVFDRMRGDRTALATALTTIDSTDWSTYIDFDQNTGWDTAVTTDQGYLNNSGSTFVSHVFRRAPGFFDVVCYTGNGANRTITHNLGVAPELMIVKCRSTVNDWAVYANNDSTDYLLLNSTAATADNNTYWNDTSPTASVFSVGTNADVNTTAATYVAYLFATVAGVSKIGSYTGNGSNQTINCGFAAGARFILIKATSTTGDWYVYDSARGIVSGNDPHLSLNSTAAEVTTDDSIDPDNSGFIVNQLAATNINVSSATYIFLAIA